MKNFKYLGITFTPLRQFSRKEKAAELGVVGHSTGVSNYKDMPALNHISSDWSYEEFYNKAKKAGAGEMDIFLMDGRPVVPCDNELFYLNSKFSA